MSSTVLFRLPFILTLIAGTSIGRAEPLTPAGGDASLFERFGLSLTRDVAVERFSDVRGAVLRIGRDPDTGKAREVYVLDLAYGVKDGFVALARLKGMLDDGGEIDIHDPDVTPVAAPADLVGGQFVWECGDTQQALWLKELGYGIDADGRVKIERLRGVLSDGGAVDYRRPEGRARDCEVETDQDCVSDPDDECRWGVGCVDLFGGCGCVGFAGSCTYKAKIKCVNNSCYAPKACKFRVSTGLCHCEGDRDVCQNVSRELTPGAAQVACSLDGGYSVADNGYARHFVLDQETTISVVTYGVESCEDLTGEQHPKDVYLQIWYAPSFPSMVGAALIDRALDAVPHSTTFQLRTVPMGGLTLPPGDYVLEIWNNDSTDAVRFWPGFNQAGQSAPTFWRSEACDMPEWVDLTSLGHPPTLSVVLCYDASTAAVPPWADSFDTYAPLTNLHHQGGWKGWNDDVNGGAVVSPEPSHSPPQSAAIAGPSDLVHEFTGAEAGRWLFTAWMYVPADFQSGCDPDGNCGSYFILLNTYNDNGPYHWSVQLHADSITNTYIRDGVTPASLPLVREQWLPVRVFIDLTDDWYQVYYNQLPLGASESWTAGVYGGGGGATDIGAVDLFANNSTPVFYDDVALRRIGDMNCDGFVDFGDINPFVLYLSNFANWQADYPNCDPQVGDINGDGSYPSFGDINPFVMLLSRL